MAFRPFENERAIVWMLNDGSNKSHPHRVVGHNYDLTVNDWNALPKVAVSTERRSNKSPFAPRRSSHCRRQHWSSFEAARLARTCPYFLGWGRSGDGPGGGLGGFVECAGA